MAVSESFKATLSSTITYVAYHAAQRPGAIAFEVNGTEIIYQAFNRDIGCLVAALVSST